MTKPSTWMDCKGLMRWRALASSIGEYHENQQRMKLTSYFAIQTNILVGSIDPTWSDSRKCCLVCGQCLMKVNKPDLCNYFNKVTGLLTWFITGLKHSLFGLTVTLKGFSMQSLSLKPVIRAGSSSRQFIK